MSAVSKYNPKDLVLSRGCQSLQHSGHPVGFYYDRSNYARIRQVEKLQALKEGFRAGPDGVALC